MQKQKEQTMIEMKTLYADKNKLVDDMLKLKEELNQTNQKL